MGAAVPGESESEQPVDLDDERAALELRDRLRRQRVPLLVVDDEQLASRLILPSEPNVQTQVVVARVVSCTG